MKAKSQKCFQPAFASLIIGPGKLAIIFRGIFLLFYKLDKFQKKHKMVIALLLLYFNNFWRKIMSVKGTVSVKNHDVSSRQELAEFQTAALLLDAKARMLNVTEGQIVKLFHNTALALAYIAKLEKDGVISKYTVPREKGAVRYALTENVRFYFSMEKIEP